MCSTSVTPEGLPSSGSVIASESPASNAEIPFKSSLTNTDSNWPTSAISTDFGSSEDIDLDETDLPESAQELAGFLSALAASMSNMIARGPSTVKDKADGGSPAVTSTSEDPSTSSNEQQPSVEPNGKASSTEGSGTEVESTDAAAPSIEDNDEDLLALLALLSPEPPRPADESDADGFQELLATLSPAPPTLSLAGREPVAGTAEKDPLTEGLSGDSGPPTLSAERQAREEAASDQTTSGTSESTTLSPASTIDSSTCEAVRRNDCASNSSCVTAGVTKSTAAPGYSPTVETVVPVTQINVPATTPEANTGMTKAVDANTKETRPPTSQYPCYPCGITFPDYTLFQVHLGFHSWSNPFKCNRCGHQAANALGFNVHLYETKHDEGIDGSVATLHQGSSGALRNKPQSCLSRSSPKKLPEVSSGERTSPSTIHMRPNNGVSPLAVPRPPTSTATRQKGVIVSAEQLRVFHCNAANTMGRTSLPRLSGPYGVDPSWAASEMRLLQEQWASRRVHHQINSPNRLPHQQSSATVRLDAIVGSAPMQGPQQRRIGRTKSKHADPSVEAIHNLVDNLIRMTGASQATPIPRSDGSQARHSGSRMASTGN